MCIRDRVEDDEEEEELDAPEVDAVDEAPKSRDVEPARTEEREHDAAPDHPDKRRDRHNPEDIDPGTDEERLATGQEVGQGQAPFKESSRSGGPRCVCR